MKTSSNLLQSSLAVLQLSSENVQKMFGNVHLAFWTILKIFEKWLEIFGKSSILWSTCYLTCSLRSLEREIPYLVCIFRHRVLVQRVFAKVGRNFAHPAYLKNYERKKGRISRSFINILSRRARWSNQVGKIVIQRQVTVTLPLARPLNNETPGFETQLFHHFPLLIFHAHPFPTLLSKLLFTPPCCFYLPNLFFIFVLEKHLHREARFDRQLHRSWWSGGTCENAAG